MIIQVRFARFLEQLHYRRPIGQLAGPVVAGLDAVHDPREHLQGGFGIRPLEAHLGQGQSGRPPLVAAGLHALLPVAGRIDVLVLAPGAQAEVVERLAGLLAVRQRLLPQVGGVGPAGLGLETFGAQPSGFRLQLRRRLRAEVVQNAAGLLEMAHAQLQLAAQQPGRDQHLFLGLRQVAQLEVGRQGVRQVRRGVLQIRLGQHRVPQNGIVGLVDRGRDLGDDVIQLRQALRQGGCVVARVEADHAQAELQPGFFAFGDRLLFRRFQPFPRLGPQRRRLICCRAGRLPHPGRAEKQVRLAGQLRMLVLRIQNVLGQFRRLLRVAVVFKQPPRLGQVALERRRRLARPEKRPQQHRRREGADAQHESRRLPQTPQRGARARMIDRRRSRASCHDIPQTPGADATRLAPANAGTVILLPSVRLVTNSVRGVKSSRVDGGGWRVEGGWWLVVRKETLACLF